MVKDIIISLKRWIIDVVEADSKNEFFDFKIESLKI